MAAVKKEETRNLYQRLSAIMAECHGLDKSGRNDFHKYNYITAEQVDNLVRPLMVKHGVVLRQGLVEREDGTMGISQDGNITRIIYSFTWQNIDEPEDFAVDHWIAYGQDNGDKGPNKCHTAARKYYLLKFFMLGSDVDADKEKDQPQIQRNDSRTAHEIVVSAAKALAKDKGLDWDELPNERKQKAIDFVKGRG